MTKRKMFDRSIGFLLADVSRLLRTDFDRRVRTLGMTQAQWRAIAHIARDEGINQSTLAERLEVQPITIGRLIDRMESAGWVERQPDAADRRASLLFLTEKSRPVLEEMQARADEALKAAMHGISAGEEKTLIAALERMKLNLGSPQEAPGESRGVEDGDVRRETRTG